MLGGIQVVMFMLSSIVSRLVISQAIKKLLNDPASANQSHLRHQDLNQETAQRMLARLKGDIQSCVDCDQVYSPDADAKRQLIGKHAYSYPFSDRVKEFA